MSILEDIAIGGVKGSIGDMGPTGSGGIVSIALSSWALNSPRILLDDICCDNFISTSGIDVYSTSYYHPNGFVTSPATGSGISYEATCDGPMTTTLIDEFSFPNVSGSLRPPALEYAAAAYSSQDNSMYIFGGHDGTSLSSDLWKFDCGSYEWRKLLPPTSPPARYSHTLSYNSISGSLIVFGGTVASGTVGDMWSYSIANNTWTQVFGTGDKPYNRTEHMAAYNFNSNELFIWRGRDHIGTWFPELFRYRFFDNTWQRAESSAGTHAKSVLIYDPVKDTVVCIAGYDNARTPVSTMYSTLLGVAGWAQQESAYPIARFDHTTVLDPYTRNLLIFGGYADGNQEIYGMSVYNLDTGATADSPTNCPNLSRAGHCAVFNTKDRSMYIYGGRPDSRSPISSQLIKYTHALTNLNETDNVRYSERFLTKTWSHLDSIRIDSFSNGPFKYYTAASFDDGITWKIYDPINKWSNIVQNVAGQWKYRNAAGTWVNAPENSLTSAWSSAFSLSNNQWTRDTTAVYNEQNKSSIPILSTNNYSVGGYVASASSQYNADCNVYRAFQGTVNFGADLSYWLNSAAPINGQWIQIDLADKPIMPLQFRIRAPWYNAGDGRRCPKRFTISGSNNLTQWDPLVTTFASADMPSPGGDNFSAWYPTTATGTYRYIRLTTISSQNDASYVGIKKIEFKSSWDINNLTRSEWESTGGFVPGTTRSVQIAVGFPFQKRAAVVNSITPTYVTAIQPSSDLITTSWLASANNPTKAQCVIKCKLVDSIILDTDLKAYVSMDGGVNYEQITGLQVVSTVGGYSYIIGTKSNLIPYNSNIIKTKVSISNFKVIQIYAICTAVDYS